MSRFTGEVDEIHKKLIAESASGDYIWWRYTTKRVIKATGTFYSERGISRNDVNFDIPKGTRFAYTTSGQDYANGYVPCWTGYLYVTLAFRDLEGF